MAPKPSKAAAPAAAAPAPAAAAATDAVAAPAAAAPAPDGLRGLLAGGFEALGAQLFLTVTGNSITQVLRVGLAGSPFLAPVVGAVRLLTAVGLFSLLYGQRFRPGRDALQATAETAKSLLATWRLALTRPVLLLLAFHAAQLAVLLSPLVLGASAFPPYDAASACFTSGALWWGVAWEELVYRAMLFYIVLQRSGGQVRVASFVSSAVFGAVHLANAAQGATPVAIVVLQAATAVMFGAAYSAIFAATGSVGATVAAHAANNLVALVWVAVDPTPAPAGAPPCSSRYSATLVASLAVQGAAYLAAAALAHQDLGEALTAADVRAAGGAGNAFRAMHPLPYGGQQGPDADAAAGDKRKAD